MIKTPLDTNFKPLIKTMQYFEVKGTQNVDIMIEDKEGFNFTIKTKITDDFNVSYNYVERLVKSLIWICGGITVYLQGANEIGEKLKLAYSPTGERSFDYHFMNKVYNGVFKIVTTNELPPVKMKNLNVGGNLTGARIGFDAGGSDRKVSAVLDGKVIFSEEVVWHPKITSDPNYHFNGIVSALKKAARYLPRVDSVGISSAGIYINNLTCVASLFLSVPEDKYYLVKDIYPRAVQELGPNIPYVVANDGDVTALAGGISLGTNEILGIAMGTSEAGGYLNKTGGLNGWLSELAFAPVDLQDNAPNDPWANDVGTGVNYFSQDAVIRLAKTAGIAIDESLSPAEKLLIVQDLMKNNDSRAKLIYETIGIYLGYTIPFYARFYDIKVVLVLGRVLSGKGGDLIVDIAQNILNNEFANLKIEIKTPDEHFKRVGQSIAASSL